jgi:hypothetical protein
LVRSLCLFRLATAWRSILTESQNAPSGEEFGQERLCALLEDCDDMDLNATKRCLLGALRLHAGQTAYEDDLTLLLIEISSNNVPSPARAATATRSKKPSRSSAFKAWPCGRPIFCASANGECSSSGREPVGRLDRRHAGNATRLLMSVRVQRAIVYRRPNEEKIWSGTYFQKV